MRTFSSASHIVPTRHGQTVSVSTFLKVMVAMLLTLPLGAYITGTLVASQAEMPSERAPVVIEDAPSPTVTVTATPSPSPDSGKGRKNQDRDDDDDDDDRDDWDDDDDSDDRVRVIRPTPRDVDDDNDDSRDDHDDDSHDSADGTDDD
jgi:hypothetical protein